MLPDGSLPAPRARVLPRSVLINASDSQPSPGPDVPPGIWVALGLCVTMTGLATGAALRLRAVSSRQRREVAAAEQKAMTDALTGILNRRGFIEAAERELDRARRYQHPLAFAFVDIRGLKTVNDTQGHMAGDMLLKAVAMLLCENSRSHDIVGRIGGDELALLLVEQSAQGVAAVGRRVKSQVPAHRRRLGLDQEWDLTVGISTFPDDGQTVDELLAAADRRLYMQRGIHVREPDALAARERALQPLDRGNGAGVDTPEDGEVD